MFIHIYTNGRCAIVNDAFLKKILCTHYISSPLGYQLKR